MPKIDPIQPFEEKLSNVRFAGLIRLILEKAAGSCRRTTKCERMALDERQLGTLDGPDSSAPLTYRTSAPLLDEGANLSGI
jgi:hypothetical protein